MRLTVGDTMATQKAYVQVKDLKSTTATVMRA